MIYLHVLVSILASQDCDEERLYRSKDLPDTGAIDIFGMNIAITQP